MKSGYDQFFKDARKAAVTQPQASSNKKRTKVRLNIDQSESDIEDQIRKRFKMSSAPRKKKKSTPWKLIAFSFFGFVMFAAGFTYIEEVETFIKRIEVTVNGQAYAESAPKTAPAKQMAAPAASSGEPNPSPTMSSAELDHFKNLNERKKELDAREVELQRMETEIAAQREELNKKMKELEDMRSNISTVLEDKVKVDETKLETLVQLYTNMKPPQAAKVFETMDEDLAVEILGRMKKKSAADIMNLLQPDKAQILSEMYAGFKRSPASNK